MDSKESNFNENRSSSSSSPPSPSTPPSSDVKQYPSKEETDFSDVEKEKLQSLDIKKSDEEEDDHEKKKVMKKLKSWIVDVKNAILKVGKDDPRRIVHSLKVGLALTLASLLYLLDPFYHGMGTNSIWAVLTVIVVLEFTAGATLYKGVNRSIGTLGAISLAFLVELVARHSGGLMCAFFTATAVFVVGASTTYARFISAIKNYDPGMIVFLLTFNMLISTGYHDQTVWHMVVQRIYAVAIGFGVCIAVSVFILPCWSGEDLQNSIVKKFEVLAELLKAHVEEYFCEHNDREENIESSKDSTVEDKYQEILEYTSADESLAKFASWEPRHSRYCYPWQQYVHLESVLHHFGHNIFAIYGCLESQIQAPQPVRALFKEPCVHVAEEVVKVLVELADAIKNHHHCSPHLSNHLHEALQELNKSIKAQPRLFLTSKPIQEPELYKPTECLEWQNKRQSVEQSKDANVKMINRTKSKTVITCLEFSETLPFAAFTSLLVETAARLDLLIEEVEELGRAAHYEEFHEDTDIRIVVASDNADCKHNQGRVSIDMQGVQSSSVPRPTD